VAQSRPAATTTTTKAGTVDLNRASLAQLQAVDGISEALAVQIIDHRKTKPFTSVSELIELDDVDKALLAKVRPALTVGTPK
jgi:competence protein ComEA